MSKYDWSVIPDDINWFATDSDGVGWGYYKEPWLSKNPDADRWQSKEDDIAYFCISRKSNPVVKGSGWWWKNTLEGRPE